LLVVIAIIAILAAILFPVFAQAREKARQITCASNLKQIGLGILQYEQDFDEEYPMLDYNDGSGNEVRWYQSVSPYVKNGQTFSWDSYYNGSGGIWTCPDLPVNQPANYGANWELFLDGAPYAATGYPTPGVKISTVDSPSMIVMVSEKGLAKGNTSWLQFQPWEGMWTNGGGTAANNYSYQPHLDIVAPNDTDETISAQRQHSEQFPFLRRTRQVNGQGLDQLVHEHPRPAGLLRGPVNRSRTVQLG
jgi:competence protein ComGC